MSSFGTRPLRSTLFLGLELRSGNFARVGRCLGSDDHGLGPPRVVTNKGIRGSRHRDQREEEDANDGHRQAHVREIGRFVTRRPPQKWALALCFTALGACSSANAPVPRTQPPRSRVVSRPLPVLPGTSWQPLDFSIDADLRGPTLPLDDSQVVRPEGADARFTALTKEAREKLLGDGFVVLPNEHGPKLMSVLYTDLAAARIPYLVTLDALFELTHLAIAAALAEVETRETLVVLKSLLARMETRLKVAQVGAPSDLLAPYALCLGYVAVAQSLLSPTYSPPIEVAEAVARETGKILAHRSDGTSPLLGVKVDYATFVPRAGAGLGEAGRAYRALAWVAHAPLVLAAKKGRAAHPLDVSLLRTHTRAALIFARLLDPAVDPEAARGWERIETLAHFLVGSADDLSPRGLAQLATASKIDVRDTKGLVDVARIDRLRRLATADPVRLHDGIPPSVRLLGARWTPDSAIMESLVFPVIQDRRLPGAIDVVMQLRARDEAALALDSHASVYLSGLDAVATMLQPSLAAGGQPAVSSRAAQKRSLEAALSAWTTLRHDFSSAGRAPVTALPSVSASEEGRAALVFVEPHPEAIAKLVMLVRQALRGLSAMGALPAESPAKKVLSDVDQLLGVAFEVALLSANDEPPSADQAATLSNFPRWLSVLEGALSSESARVVDVHTDLENGQVLEEATGYPEELYLVMREPRTGRMVLTVGAVLPHYEFVQNTHDRLTDDAWRARLEAGNAPPR